MRKILILVIFLAPGLLFAQNKQYQAVFEKQSVAIAQLYEQLLGGNSLDGLTQDEVSRLQEEFRRIATRVLRQARAEVAFKSGTWEDPCYQLEMAKAAAQTAIADLEDQRDNYGCTDPDLYDALGRLGVAINAGDDAEAEGCDGTNYTAAASDAALAEDLAYDAWLDIQDISGCSVNDALSYAMDAWISYHNAEYFFQ